MARIIPTVARIMHYYPRGQADSAMIRRATETVDSAIMPLACIVVDVIADNLVNVTVFDALGAGHSRVHVPVVQEGDPWSNERTQSGWVSWPVITPQPHLRSGAPISNQPKQQLGKVASPPRQPPPTSTDPTS